MSYFQTRICKACGTQNRAPARHLANSGRCGRCRAELPPAAAPIDVDEAAFHSIVRECPVPILVDFWAGWCGPCRMAAPEVEAVARERTGEAVVLKVDTERNPDLSAQFGIRSIPTFVVLHGGRTVLQQSGVAPRAEMLRWLQSATART